MLNGRMLKTYFKRLIGKLYILGRNEANNIYQERKYKLLENYAVFESSTYIDFDAEIVNSTGDKSRIAIGKNCIVRGSLLVYKHGGRINVGDYCFIGPNTKVWSAKNISIGNRVLIAHNVNIHDNNSHPLNAEKRHLDYVHILKHGLQDENDLNEKDVIIGDDAWIGYNSTILKGVTIGKGAIVGACSLVDKDVPDFAIVVGNPARVIKYTD
jgi:acetyltransferase-like isoleucine patch superfamily enzyme